MKKMFFSLVVLLTLASAPAFSQKGHGGGHGGRMKQMLIDSVQLSPEQADSVIAIRHEFEPQLKAIKEDQSIEKKDKKAKMKELESQITARYKSNSLSDDQIMKLKELHKHTKGGQHEMIWKGKKPAEPAPVN